MGCKVVRWSTTSAGWFTTLRLFLQILSCRLSAVSPPILKAGFQLQFVESPPPQLWSDGPPAPLRASCNAKVEPALPHAICLSLCVVFLLLFMSLSSSSSERQGGAPLYLSFTLYLCICIFIIIIIITARWRTHPRSLTPSTCVYICICIFVYLCIYHTMFIIIRPRWARHPPALSHAICSTIPARHSYGTGDERGWKHNIFPMDG